jgi:hypothetical protein
MDTSRYFRLPASLLVLALLAGCAAKKTAGPPLPPSQTPAPAAPEPTPQPTPTPAQQSQLPAQGTPPPEPEQTQAATAKNDKKPNNGKQHGNKKSAATSGGNQTAKIAPPKIVVRPDAEPPASGGQISPGGTDIARGEPSTEQLLQSTETNLTNLKGQLSSDEQATVTRFATSSTRAARRPKKTTASALTTLPSKRICCATTSSNDAEENLVIG